MARRPKNKGDKKSNKGGKSPKMGGMPKFTSQRGGTTKEIEKQFKTGSGGSWLRVGKDEEYTVAILTPPSEWDRYPEHTIQTAQGFVYIPCGDPCPTCQRMPENEPRYYAAIPMYIYEYKKVQYFRATGPTATSLIGKYERFKKSFFQRQWFLTRIDGDGPTKYEIDPTDEKTKKKEMTAEIPDYNTAMAQKFSEGLERLGWTVSGEQFDSGDEDEDEAPWGGDEDDVDLDDIKEMTKKELVAFIKENELDIDHKGAKLKALRKAVIRVMEDQ